MRTITQRFVWKVLLEVGIKTGINLKWLLWSEAGSELPRVRLNDLVFSTSTNRYSGEAFKKICPSHRHFEWFIDCLRDEEKKDVTSVLEIHIFITQFFHKFDLRTTMLYICENHFQRLSHTTMFTGLKAVNHFGRPHLTSFLKFVQRKHSYVSKIGVFSCGPRPLTKSVTSACEDVNRGHKLPYFIHHFDINPLKKKKAL